MPSNRLGRIPVGGSLGHPFDIEFPGGELSIRRQDKYQVAGIKVGFAPTLTIGFQMPNFLVAIPEFFPVDGRLTDIAFYKGGALGADVCWMGVFADRNLGGADDHYPGSSVVANLVPGATGGAGGDLFLQESSVSFNIAAGTILWFVGQSKETTGNFGCSTGGGNGSIWRIPFGYDTPATITGATVSKGGFMGIRTNAGVTYDSTLSTFPTSSTELINCTSQAWGSGGTHAAIHVMFFKFLAT